MVNRLISSTRYVIFIPVIGSWLASLIATILGAYEVIISLLGIPTGITDKSLKILILNLVEAVDLFLLGTAFYLIALGLYELFIDSSAPVPDWLVIGDFDDLKKKLLSVVVVVLAVQFLAQVLGWNGQTNLLTYGSAVAVVILALSLFLAAQKNH